MRGRDLAGLLEVSERTIYRDIADLVGSGVPIHGEAGVGYMMREGFDLPPLMFTTEEIIALTSGARMIGAWGGTDMARGAESALEKITSALPEALRARAEAVAVHAIPRPSLTHAMRETIDTLERAVTQRTRIGISYADEAGNATVRTVRPIGLWYWGPVWTLVAWCELREAFRMFRIDRITEPEEIGPFDPSPGQTIQDFYRSELSRHPEITTPGEGNTA